MGALLRLHAWPDERAGRRGSLAACISCSALPASPQRVIYGIIATIRSFGGIAHDESNAPCQHRPFAWCGEGGEFEIVDASICPNASYRRLLMSGDAPRVHAWSESVAIATINSQCEAAQQRMEIRSERIGVRKSEFASTDKMNSTDDELRCHWRFHAVHASLQCTRTLAMRCAHGISYGEGVAARSCAAGASDARRRRLRFSNGTRWTSESAKAHARKHGPTHSRCAVARHAVW